MKVLNIGRSENADIVINNPAVSRRHAMLRMHWNGKMEIVDLSSNGTSVNNNPIKSNSPYPIKKGDVIVLANAVKLDWKTVKNPYFKYWVGVAGVVVLAAIITMILLIPSRNHQAQDYDEYISAPVTKDTTTLARPQTENDSHEEGTEADIASPIDRYIPDQNHESGRNKGTKRPKSSETSSQPNESEPKSDDGVSGDNILL